MRGVLAFLAALCLVAAPAFAGYPNGFNGNGFGGYSGYLTASGAPFTEINATWRVPQVIYDTSGGTAPLSTDGMFIWPGISAPGNLIQAGTAQFFQDANGTLLTRAWYECFNAESVQYLDTGMYPVKIFDTVTTTLTCSAGCTASNAAQTWNIVIQDLTQGWTFTLNNHACVTGLGDAWVVIESNDVTHAHYSDIPFINVRTNNANPGFVNSNELYGFSTGGTSTATSNPSDPNATTDGFKLCWGSGDTGQTGTTGYTTCPNAPSLNKDNGRGFGF